MRPLRPIFFASFLFSFHLALLSYLNSTVLAGQGSALETTLAYTAGSALSLLLVIIAPRIVQHTGASVFLGTTLVLSAVLLGLLSTTMSGNAFLTLFVLYFSLNTVIWYGFDLVIEHFSRANITGNIRGLYLTLNNSAWVFAPVLASVVSAYAGFRSTYMLAGCTVLIALGFITTTKRVRAKDLGAPQLSLLAAFGALVAHQEARRIVSLYFIIQFFFAWMVLYMAPYLLDLGFSWNTIGIIFAVMLLPFVLFQYAAGKIADKHHAEKKLIITGFIVAGIATLLLALPIPTTAIAFAAILFLTRVGASVIEVGCESAFFKEVTEKDTALIGTLRMALPLAYIIAPLVGSVVLSLSSMPTLFAVLAILLFIAALYAGRLQKR